LARELRFYIFHGGLESHQGWGIFIFATNVLPSHSTFAMVTLWYCWHQERFCSSV